jgi:hypothetical protein
MALVKEWIRDEAKFNECSAPRDEAIKIAERISAETGHYVRVFDSDGLIFCHWLGKPHKCFVNGYGERPERPDKPDKRK